VARKRTPAPKTPDRFPYMVIKPNDNPNGRAKYRDHKEAVRKLREEVDAMYDQFKNLNTPDIRQHCVDIISALGRLPREGGVVDLPLGPIRYRVELVRRQTI